MAEKEKRQVHFHHWILVNTKKLANGKHLYKYRCMDSKCKVTKTEEK